MSIYPALASPSSGARGKHDHLSHPRCTTGRVNQIFYIWTICLRISFFRILSAKLMEFLITRRSCSLCFDREMQIYKCVMASNLAGDAFWMFSEQNVSLDAQMSSDEQHGKSGNHQKLLRGSKVEALQYFPL